MSSFTVQAPANLALIKYMGKTSTVGNVPCNPSLSYTLPHLQSTVQLTPHDLARDTWMPLTGPHHMPLQLNNMQQRRYIEHLQRIKKSLGYTGNFSILSANNFPDSTGLASSSASFSALTQAAAQAICHAQGISLPPIAVLTQWSQQGSGSSCRSFFPQWALWDDQSVRALPLPLHPLLHLTVVVTASPKAVSSSEAHQYVHTSPHFIARQKRVRERLHDFITYAQWCHWPKLYHLATIEYEEMHELFATAAQPFSYRTQATEQVLNTVTHCWRTQKNGPLTTLDAGPNVHMLFRPQDQDLFQELKQHFKKHYEVLSSDGSG